MFRILVVDDDRSIRRTLELILQREGYSVTTARDARSAIIAAERSQNDVIVLDLDLPDGDAFEAMEALAAMPAA